MDEYDRIFQTASPDHESDAESFDGDARNRVTTGAESSERVGDRHGTVRVGYCN